MFPQLFPPIWKDFIKMSGFSRIDEHKEDLLKGHSHLYETSYGETIVRGKRESIDHYLVFLTSPALPRYNSVVLRTQLNLYQLLDRMNKKALDTAMQDLNIPSWYVATVDKGDPSREDYLEFLALKCAEHKFRLLRLVKVMLGLREAVRGAIKLSFLDDDCVKALKAHLEPFQDDYFNACVALRDSVPMERDFIDRDSEHWWITDKDMKPSHSKASSHVSDAYSFSPAMRSSLNFIVPTVMLLTVIPAALAWKYDPNRKGDWKDSQLYQTIAGNGMQLLGLVMFVWPTWSHPRLSRLNWVWIWLLAGFSALCALSSIALYVTVSSTWSFVVAFAGVLAQAIVQLQVINAI